LIVLFIQKGVFIENIVSMWAKSLNDEAVLLPQNVAKTNRREAKY